MSTNSNSVQPWAGSSLAHMALLHKFLKKKGPSLRRDFLDEDTWLGKQNAGWTSPPRSPFGLVPLCRTQSVQPYLAVLSFLSEPQCVHLQNGKITSASGCQAGTSSVLLSPSLPGPSTEHHREDTPLMSRHKGRNGGMARGKANYKLFRAVLVASYRLGSEPSHALSPRSGGSRMLRAKGVVGLAA